MTSDRNIHMATSCIPHSSTAAEVVKAHGVDPAQGLTAAEIVDRRSRHGANILRAHPPANPLRVLLKQFMSPVVYLLLGAAGFALLIGQTTEFIAILAVLVINAGIGFITELRAVRSMEALRQLATRSVVVRREGRIETIPAEQLVRGDIVIIDAGDVIAADMRIIASANLASDELALTGESLPVAKDVQTVAPDTPLADRTCMLFKGCAITRGTGEAIVTGTGMDTELGRISKLVEQSAPERSPLERQLEVLSRHLIWVTILIAAAVGAAGMLAGQNVTLMVETSVALAVAAIPEGLPIVATLALARGMLRMARHNALIERLSAVETLGSTTVIMTDKTGTLTENRMHVDRIVTNDGELDFDRDSDRFLMAGHGVSGTSNEALRTLLVHACLCNNASLGENGQASTGDPMEISLLEAASADGIERSTLLTSCPEVAEHAFDAATRMMATVHKDGRNFTVAVKGAPEAVLAHVKRVNAGNRSVPFDRQQRLHWNDVCEVLAAQGLRLLAIAGKNTSESDVPPYQDLTLLGIVAFQDPPRADVATAIADARRAGINVIMVTGDHAATANHISQAIGLAPHGFTAITSDELKSFSEMSKTERAQTRSAHVFSRVTPEQKLDLITLHQQAGEVVAMTGDGVNDAPALRKADIGIAMGLRGTQVAREAADMVLRDDAFSTIVHAIREGRIIYTNIRRFTTYLLSCNLSEILIVGLAVLVGLPLPLLPLQILFLNLVTDVFPAFALGTIAADRNVLARPPKPPDEPILNKSQWLTIVAGGSVIAATTLSSIVLAIFVFDLQGDAITTMCFFTLALAQLWHVFNMRNWRDGLILNQITRNTYVWLAIALCLIILTIAALQPEIAGALRLTPLPGKAWAAVIALSLIPVFVREVIAAGKRLKNN